MSLILSEYVDYLTRILIIILSAIRTQKYNQTLNHDNILKLQYMIAHKIVQYMTTQEHVTR